MKRFNLFPGTQADKLIRCLVPMLDRDAATADGQRTEHIGVSVAHNQRFLRGAPRRRDRG